MRCAFVALGTSCMLPLFHLRVLLRAGFWAEYGEHEATHVIVNVYRRMLRTWATEHDVVGLKRECSPQLGDSLAIAKPHVENMKAATPMRALYRRMLRLCLLNVSHLCCCCCCSAFRCTNFIRFHCKHHHTTGKCCRTCWHLLQPGASSCCCW